MVPKSLAQFMKIDLQCAGTFKLPMNTGKRIPAVTTLAESMAFSHYEGKIGGGKNLKLRLPLQYPFKALRPRRGSAHPVQWFLSDKLLLEEPAVWEF